MIYVLRTCCSLNYKVLLSVCSFQAIWFVVKIPHFSFPLLFYGNIVKSSFLGWPHRHPHFLHGWICIFIRPENFFVLVFLVFLIYSDCLRPYYCSINVVEIFNCFNILILLFFNVSFVVFGFVSRNYLTFWSCFLLFLIISAKD